MSITIRIIGADWCPDCRRIKDLLNEKKISFVYEDQGDVKEKAKDISGNPKIPCCVFPGPTFLNEPSNEDMMKKLMEIGLVDSST